MTAGAAMAAEMAEQPGRLADVLARADEIGRRVRGVLPDPLAGTVLIARGVFGPCCDGGPLSSGAGGRTIAVTNDSAVRWLLPPI